MAEKANEKGTDKDTDAPAAEPPPAGAQNTETNGEGAGMQAVPYERFKEVNDQLKALKDADKKRAADQEKAERAQMAERGEFQKLAEQASKRAEDAEAKLQAVLLEAQRMKQRVEFHRVAEDGKYRFANAQAEDDAFGFIPADAEDVGKALKELAKSRPYLFKPAQGADIDGSAGTGSGGPPPQDTATKQAELRQRFRIM